MLISFLFFSYFIVCAEALRKYPPFGLVLRMATKDYKVPGMDFTLKKGTSVWIPVYGVHHDPDIYPNPEVFDPERFTPEEIKKRPSTSFLAFGDGPRNCIGLRFGLLQTRVGLATLLKNFDFSACSKTSIPLKFNAKNVVLTSKDKLWLNVKPIE